MTEGIMNSNQSGSDQSNSNDWIIDFLQKPLQSLQRATKIAVRSIFSKGLCEPLGSWAWSGVRPSKILLFAIKTISDGSTPKIKQTRKTVKSIYSQKVTASLRRLSMARFLEKGTETHGLGLSPATTDLPWYISL